MPLNSGGMDQDIIKIFKSYAIGNILEDQRHQPGIGGRTITKAKQKLAELKMALSCTEGRLLSTIFIQANAVESTGIINSAKNGG